MLLGPGPRTIGIKYDYFDISETHQLLLEMFNGVDMGFSRASFTNLAGGFRFGSNDSTTFRWRAGLLDADFTRKFFSLGATILDYDKTGTLERDFTYINVRVGPALRLGSPKFALMARATGSLGGSSIVFGETNYPGAGLDEETELSGFEAGYKGAITLSLKNRFSLSADYGERIIDGAPEPHFKTMSAGVQVRLGGEMFGGKKLFLRFEREELSFAKNGFVQMGNRIELGLQILPNLPDRPDFPEE